MKQWLKRRSIAAIVGLGLLAGPLAVSTAQANTERELRQVRGYSGDGVAARESVLDQARTAPDSDFSWMMESINIQEIERTETAIRELRQLVAATPQDDHRRPERMFRLAELYFERSAYYEQRAYQRRDEAFAVRDANPSRAAAYERAAQDDLAQSARTAADARNLYAELYTNHRTTFADIDQVLFRLGASLLQAEQYAAAQQVFEELVTNYPRSVFIPQAMYMLGDLMFAEGDLPAAIRYYDIVIQSPGSVVYARALYKKAWALYNLANNRRRFQEALDTLYQAVEASRAQQPAGAPDSPSTQQYLRDIPLFYSDVYGGDVAIEFFRRIAPDSYASLCDRLARIYADKAMYQDSNTVFRQLIELNPESFRIVDYQTEIVRNTIPSSSQIEATREIRRLVQLYNVSQSLSDATPELIARTGSAIEQLVRLTATSYHRDAQVTRNEQLYALAFNLYQDYIANFPEGEEAYTMWFYYAELLYRNEDWQQAAEAYERALSFSPGDGEFDEEAVYAACLAYTKMVDITSALQGSEGQAMQEEGQLPPVPEARPIPQEYQNMMAACDRYLAAGTTPETAVEIEYVIAYMYYSYDHLEEAARRFQELATTKATIDRERAEESVMLLLDCYALQRDWGAMRRYIEQFQSSPLNRGELGAALTRLGEQVSFKECRDMQEASNHQGAAYCFFDFVNNNFESELVDRAIFNSAISFREIDNIEYSVALFDQLVQVRPNSELVPNTLYQLGQTFHRLAIYSVAADYYEQYVRVAPNGDYVFDALINASNFRIGLEQWRQAQDTLRSFVRVAERDAERGGPEVVAEANYQMGLITERQRAASDSVANWERYIRSYGRTLPSRGVEAYLRIADVWTGARRPERADRYYAAAVEFVDSLTPEERAALSTDAQDAAARAQFMLAEQVWARYEAVNLNRRTEAQIREAVTTKLQIGAEAAQLYDRIVFGSTRPGWQIAALTRLGQLYHNFFLQLIDAPVPPGLPPLVEEEYRTEIENRAAQQKEAAAVRYLRALEIARETGWFNEYSRLAARQLQELDPAYASGSEVRTEPGFDNPRAYASPFVGVREQRPSDSGLGAADAPADSTTPRSADGN